MNASPRQLALDARIGALYRFSRITILLTLVLAPIVVWRGGPHASQAALLVWWGYISAVSLGRWGLMRLHARHEGRGDPLRWARLSVLGATLVGIGWGCLALPWVGFSPAAMPAVISLLMAIAAIGLYSFMPYWQAYLGLILPITVGMLVGVISNRAVMSVEFGLIVVALCATMVLGCRRVGRHYEQLLLARFEAGGLAEAANAASRAKSLFLANVSHEIRTPLNAVMGFGQLLRNAPLGAPEQRQVEGILTAGDSLLHVVDDILEYSTIESGELQLAPEPGSLQQLVRELEQVYRPMAEGKGLAFVLDIDPQAADGAFFDRLRVRQVLGILVRNAIKFTRSGSVEVRLAAPVTRGESQMQRFEVRDTGVGIAEEVREHVFEPFWQADASSTRKYGGTGLGLALARQLAELHGGTLHFSTRTGAGSCFVLEIPLQTVEIAPEPAPALRPRPPEALSGRVLLAEDEPVNRELTVLILQRMGLSVETAHDGAEAVKAFERAPPDLVLMDCQMPTMDGYAAARAIRALPLARHVPIIALTAHALAADRDACFAAGMDAHLTKPVSIPALQDCLATWLPAAGGSAPP